MATKTPSSLEIAQEATLLPIAEIAAAAGLEADEVDLYGKYKAKISLSVLERLADRPDAKLVCVTAITPTKFGEGKTTTSVSLTQGLGAIGRKPVLCLREASLGPVFGIKGGAAGAGYAQVVPMEDMNLHFTGDIHAIGAANNLLAAMLEAHLLHGNKLGVDPLTISWRRCLDINDRALRDVVVGLGGKANGYTRQSGFDITAASEVMAILALSTSLADMRARFGRVVVGYTPDGGPVTAEQMGCARGNHRPTCLYVCGASPSPSRRLAMVSGCSVRARARLRAVSRRVAFFGDRSRWAVSMRLESSSAATSATSSAPRRVMMTVSRSWVTRSHRRAKFARASVYVVWKAMRDASREDTYRATVQ